MAEPGEADPLEQAIRRLLGAVGQLEAAVAQSLERAHTAQRQARELEIFAEDRARLAEDLDAANARAVSLANANREVSRRLDQTMESIRAVLGAEA